MPQSTLQNYELYEYLKSAEEWVRFVFKDFPELRKPSTYRQINEVLVSKYNLTKYNNDRGLITLDRASRKVRKPKEKDMAREQDYRYYYGAKY